MPQVVADGRNNKKFESIMQPYKQNKKYLHIYSEDKKKWLIKNLNP